MDDKRKQTQAYARKTLIDTAFSALGIFLILSITKAYSWQIFVPYFISYQFLYQIAYFIAVRWVQKHKQRKQALRMVESNK